jgi:PAS domain S-box-containing protein
MAKILAIDDKQEILDLISSLLTRLIPECVVLTAKSGIKGIEKAKTELPDTILLDFQMPEMDGFEVCKRLKTDKDTMHIPVIMLTGVLVDLKSRVKGLQLGADAFLAKPIEGTELAAQVKVMLRIKKAEDILRKEKDLLEEVVQERTKALLESEEIYRTLFKNAAEAIYVAQDGKIKFLNPKTEELYGYSAEELTSKPFTDFIYEKDQKMVLERHKKRLRSEVLPSTYPFRIINKAGETKWVEINVVSFSWENRPATLCFLTDISERTKNEEKKREIEAQLLQSEKMASIGQLAAGVAHEINNPTGFVSSNLKTLSDYQNDISTLIREYRNLVARLKDTKGSEEYSSFISEQIERIRSLETEVEIDYVLNDIPDLIKDCREGTERIKKIVIDLKDFAHPGDDKLKYADINKGLDSTLNGEIRIVTRADDSHVEISISDTGAGIPEENLSKIFDPFFTTKEVGKGTGLGLNMAYNIIQKHQGSIDVESETGKGTTFIIRLQTDPDLQRGVK